MVRRMKRHQILQRSAWLVWLVMIFMTTWEARSQGVPEAVNFQGVARAADGSHLASTHVLLRLSITQSGTLVYAERHETETDDLGHFNLAFGTGRVESGTFTSIPWGSGELTLRIEIGVKDGPLGLMGEQRILSVPYSIYARASMYADTAGTAKDFSSTLPPSKGGTGSSDMPVAGGVVYGDGTRYRTTDRGAAGQILTASEDITPRWRSLLDIVDDATLDSLVARLAPRLGRDTAFIKSVITNTIATKIIRDIVGEMLVDTDTIAYETIRDRLLVDTKLRQTIEQIVDAKVSTSAWSLRGNAGIDPATQYLGTSDAQPLVVRTSGQERMRILANGRIGIGTDTPTETLTIRGSLGIQGPLMLNGSSGSAGGILMSNGANQSPEWIPVGQPGQVLTMNGSGRPVWSAPGSGPAASPIAGTVALLAGQTLVTVNNAAITPASVITITMRDLNDSGFVFAQIVSQQAGSFNVRLSAPVPVTANASLHYIAVTP